MTLAEESQLKVVMEHVREARRQIDRALPAGSVYPRHTEQGHFYGVPNGQVYPSVTGIISYVKDQSIQTYQMNEALRYVEANFHRLHKDGKFDIMEASTVVYEAKKAPTDAMNNAGDIGRKIHDRREQYFQEWIDNDTLERPDIASYIKDDDDNRLKSAMRALDKFCADTGYIPVRTEVLVYSDKYKLAGTLDDIGYIKTEKRPFSDACTHSLTYEGLVVRCFSCKGRTDWEFALSDLKSSNQFKDSYFYQVALYFMMFKENTNLKPERSFILKVSKENGTYSLEELENMPSLVAGAKSIIQAADAVEKVKLLRQKSTARPTITI